MACWCRVQRVAIAGRGGLARRATLLAQLRGEHPDAITVDAGGSLLGATTDQASVMVEPLWRQWAITPHTLAPVISDTAWL